MPELAACTRRNRETSPRAYAPRASTSSRKKSASGSTDSNPARLRQNMAHPAAPVITAEYIGCRTTPYTSCRRRTAPAAGLGKGLMCLPTTIAARKATAADTIMLASPANRVRPGRFRWEPSRPRQTMVSVKLVASNTPWATTHPVPREESGSSRGRSPSEDIAGCRGQLS